VLVNAANNTTDSLVIPDAQAATTAMGLQVEIFNAGNNREIDRAFASIVEKRIEALLVSTTPLFYDRRVQIVSLAARHAVPAIYFDRSIAEIGGLMTYGPTYVKQLPQVGSYAARILKGEKPVDLPVVQPTKFDFIINLQTARLLGLTVPPGLLAIADEVIE
jgi:putative ABC transport system substrate-binding protein